MTHPFARRIQELCPEMPIADVQTEHAAQHHIVFTVNYRFIFRFARTQVGAESLRRETELLLPAVARAVKLPVPKPKLSSFERLEPGFAFMGCERIDGESLWPEILEKLAETDKERAARSIGEFLHALHTMELPIDPQLERAVSDEEEDIRRLPTQKLQARTVGELFARMSPEARTRAEREFAAFAREDAKTEPEGWIHGAFGPAHVLWDTREEAVSGIVGFGSARIGDPALDLADLLAAYGSEFFEKCLDHYPGGKALVGRSQFYVGLMPLREALHGLDEDDAEWLEYGLAAYERETALLHDR